MYTENNFRFLTLLLNKEEDRLETWGNLIALKKKRRGLGREREAFGMMSLLEKILKPRSNKLSGVYH